MEQRYCSNCRAELPRDADACPECGVFCGDVFDGTWPRKKTNTRLWLIVLALAVAGAAGALWYERQSRLADSRPSPPLPGVRVVRDAPGTKSRAPGAALTEAEAIRVLRRHLVETRKISNECIALIADRSRAQYAFVVTDSCARVRIGRWRVDPKTGIPAPA